MDTPPSQHAADRAERWGGAVVAAGQRRPFAAAVAAAGAAVIAPASILGDAWRSAVPLTACATVAAALAGHAVAESPSWRARISALVAVSFVAMLLVADSVFAGRPGTARALDVGVLLVLCLAALVWAFVAPPRPPRDRVWAAVDVAAVGALAVSALRPLDLAAPSTLAGLAALPAALGALVANEAPVGGLVARAAAVAASIGTLHALLARERTPPLADVAAHAAGAAALGVLFAIAAAAARRARSLTVVPAEHPLIADLRPVVRDAR